MKWTILLMAAVALSASCQSRTKVEAASSAVKVEPAEPSACEYLTTVISGLARADGAIRAVNEAPRTDLVALMTANQNAAIAFRMSEAELEPYHAVKDTTRREATQHILDAYEMMRSSLELQMAGFEKLDSAKSADDLLGLRRQVSDAQVAYQQGSVILVEAVQMAFYSALVTDPEAPDVHVALHMTEDERMKLVGALDSQFGAALRAPKVEGSGPMQAASILLLGLDKEWKVAP